MSPNPVPNLILGAGLTGLSTAYHLGDDYVLLEREAETGGLARTLVTRGHHFDITGHWLHLRDEGVRALMNKLLGDQLVERARRARVYSHGTYTLYPYQANTYGLPAEVAAECVQGFVRARCHDRLSSEAPQALPAAETFADFILQRLGEGIAKHFMFPYNQKLWTVHPREMDASWCDRFVPVPSLDDVILGAFGQSPQALGYNTHFLYPREGGIGRVPRALHEALDGEIRCNAEVVAVDLQRREVRLADGQQLRYERLVNSLPLKHFLSMCGDVPDDIAAASRHLRHTTITYFDVAAKGANPEQPHWCYVPEPQFPFYRIGSFSAVEPGMSPPGCRSFYVEISHQGAQLDLADAEAQVVNQLCTMKLIDHPDDVLLVERRVIPVAYVLPGAEVEPARQKILAYLREHKILSTGRYGAWVYAAMEDAILDGMQAARQLREWQVS